MPTLRRPSVVAKATGKVTKKAAKGVAEGWKAESSKRTAKRWAKKAAGGDASKRTQILTKKKYDLYGESIGVKKGRSYNHFGSAPRSGVAKGANIKAATRLNKIKKSPTKAKSAGMKARAVAPKAAVGGAGATGYSKRKKGNNVKKSISK